MTRKLWLWVLFGILSIGIHVLTLMKNKVESELEPDEDDDEPHARRPD